MEDYTNHPDYFVVNIHGKHGEIHLAVPKREPTEEEIKAFHREMAKVIVDEAKRKKAKNKVKATV